MIMYNIIYDFVGVIYQFAMDNGPFVDDLWYFSFKKCEIC